MRFNDPKQVRCRRWFKNRTHKTTRGNNSGSWPSYLLETRLSCERQTILLKTKSPNDSNKNEVLIGHLPLFCFLPTPIPNNNKNCKIPVWKQQARASARDTRDLRGKAAWWAPGPGPGNTWAGRGFLGERRTQATRPAAPDTPLLSGPGWRPNPSPRPPCPPPPPGARSRSAAERDSACGAPRLRPLRVPSRPAAPPPAPPRPGPRRLAHLHARSPRVDPRVQDGDEHPPPVILRVATEEGGGPGLFLGQEAVEREGLLGRSGGHGRRLEDEEEANCQAARGRAARGHPGSRGPGRGRGAGPDANQSRPARGSRPVTYRYVSQRRRSQELGRSRAGVGQECCPGRSEGGGVWISWWRFWFPNLGVLKRPTLGILRRWPGSEWGVRVSRASHSSRYGEGKEPPAWSSWNSPGASDGFRTWSCGRKFWVSCCRSPTWPEEREATLER